MTTTRGTAIGWTATIGLVPGYGHDNQGADLAFRRQTLVREWFRAMRETKAETGFVVSAVMDDALVLYPHESCPASGEVAVRLTGSSNPGHVPEDRIASFMDAVEATVRRVQAAMEQRTVRIEFHRIERSVYSVMGETTGDGKMKIEDRVAAVKAQMTADNGMAEADDVEIRLEDIDGAIAHAVDGGAAIVIDRAQAEAMDDETLRFVIGHETMHALVMRRGHGTVPGMQFVPDAAGPFNDDVLGRR